MFSSNDGVNKVLDIPADRLYRKMKRRVYLPFGQLSKVILAGSHQSRIIGRGHQHVYEKVLDIPTKPLYRRIEEKACHGI